MTINERFEEIIKVLFGGNKRAFAKAVGINPTVVENVVGARKGKPSYDVLVKVCANANISAEWLLFGSEKNLITDVFNIRKDLTLSVTPEDVAEEGGMPLKTVFTKGKKTIPKQSVSIGEAVHKVPKGSSEGIPLIPLDAVRLVFLPKVAVGYVWRTASAMSNTRVREQGGKLPYPGVWRLHGAAIL